MEERTDILVEQSSLVSPQGNNVELQFPDQDLITAENLLNENTLSVNPTDAIPSNSTDNQKVIPRRSLPRCNNCRARNSLQACPKGMCSMCCKLWDGGACDAHQKAIASSGGNKRKRNNIIKPDGTLYTQIAVSNAWSQSGDQNLEDLETGDDLKNSDTKSATKRRRTQRGCAGLKPISNRFDNPKHKYMSEEMYRKNERMRLYVRDTPMTHEEKKQLCDDISCLPLIHLDEIFKIIAHQIPHCFSHRQMTAENFDIDMSALGPATLERIEQYVYSTVKSVKNKKGGSKVEGRSNSGLGVSGKKPIVKKSSNIYSKKKKLKTNKKVLRKSSTNVNSNSTANSTSTSTSTSTSNSSTSSAKGNENQLRKSKRIQTLSNEWKKAEKIIKYLINHKYGWIFATPVDPVALNIPDYFEIIKNPMDLGTIRKKMDSAEYEELVDWAKDVRLVWRNALTYNTQGTHIHSVTKKMKALWEIKWKGLIEQFGVEDEEPDDELA